MSHVRSYEYTETILNLAFAIYVYSWIVMSALEVTSILKAEKGAIFISVYLLRPINSVKWYNIVKHII